jgi:LL-diaminopimelate aminotransferase
MPKFSPLIGSIPEYPFSKINRISREVELRDGINIINARIGIPDIEAPRTFKECLAKYVLEEGSTYGYPTDSHPARGIPEFIEAVIQHYQEKYNVKLTPDNVAVTGWNKEVLHNLVRMFGPGKVQIPDPVYPAYEGATALSFNTIVRVKTGRASGWLPEFRLAEKDTVALYFCDPNNPTGAVADMEYYRTLARGMKTNDICGIFDKAYKDYVFDDNTRPVSIVQVPGLIDYGFETVSFSKHFNLVGVGLGWVVSSKDNVDRWLRFTGHYSQGVEWYKQLAGVEALTNPAIKAEMDRYFDLVRERRSIMAKGLREVGLIAEIPQATPYLWVKVPAGYDDEDFVLNKMIGEAHVAFMPGSYFGGNGKGFFRTTLFLAKNDIEEALERINKVRSW